MVMRVIAYCDLVRLHAQVENKPDNRCTAICDTLTAPSCTSIKDKYD